LICTKDFCMVKRRIFWLNGKCYQSCPTSLHVV